MNVQTKRSLGTLRIQEKTKPKSPSMIGTIRIQRSLLNQFTDQIANSGDTELIANLAAWKNKDASGRPFLTVELSPRWGQPKQPNPTSSGSIFDFMNEDD